MKKRVIIIFGTRPEAIKMAPLIKELKKFPEIFETKVCVTGQHREMLDQVLDFFDIRPDYDLNIMKKNQNLFELTSKIIQYLRPILISFKPDYLFVHGDTTTTLSASIAGFYSFAKVCHVEAGLRTNDKLSPFPEEINRQITTRISDFHFAPTKLSKKNLINENIDETSIIVTGNTVIDALIQSINIVNENPSKLILEISEKIGKKDLILVTGHRRENFGVGFENICKAIKKIAINNPDLIIIYPVHLNPKVSEPVKQLLGKINNIMLINPVNYPDFIWLMNRSKIIITDSGGVQEEAPSLGKPVLVLRETTERPEAVVAGTVILVGTDTEKIFSVTKKLLNNENEIERMSKLHNPYGDGFASKRIVQFMKKIK